MLIHFHSNLDEAKPYIHDLNQKWKDRRTNDGTLVVVIPHKGESIEFKFTKHVEGSTCPHTFSFKLEVVDVTYSNFGNDVTIELQVPQHFNSTLHWMTWFENFTEGGTRVSEPR